MNIPIDILMSAVKNLVENMFRSQEFKEQQSKLTKIENEIIEVNQEVKNIKTEVSEIKNKIEIANSKITKTEPFVGVKYWIIIFLLLLNFILLAYNIFLK
jgi:predicted  nucleic acid-binding Zn-ribbon protein